MDDLLIHNAKIYSLEKEGEFFHAMTISNGKIVNLFTENPSNNKLRKIAKKNIDAQGSVILPGLIDSHVHFVMTAAMNVLSTPISVYEKGQFIPKNLEGVENKVIQTAKNTPKSKPLLFNNYIIPTIEEGRLPYKEEIDKWASNRLVTIIAIDGHSFSLSSKGLESLGINPDGHNGILNEDMEDFDMDKLVSLFTKSITLKIIAEGIQNTINDAIRYGLVGIHCLDGFREDPTKDTSLRFMKLLGNKIPLKLRLYPQIRNISSLQPYFDIMRTKRIGGCGAWDMDGAVGAKTAAFDKPYIGEYENYGSLLLTKEDLLPIMREAQSRNIQVTSHAIGTAAISELISAFTLLKEEVGDDIKLPRHRVDHFEFPTAEAIRAAVQELGLLIVPQPGFNWIDANFPGMNTYKKFLDPEIVQRQNPLRTILNMGGIICGSSDSPVQSLDPWLQIHGMVNFPIDSQRISLYEALRTYTYNGAYATFEENERGTISPGKFADFIMLSMDPFELDTDDIRKIKVDCTFVNGKRLKSTQKRPLGFLWKLVFSHSKKI